MAATTEQVTLEEVTIIVDNHVHDGEPVNKGEKIKVDADVKAFMIEHKIIKG